MKTIVFFDTETTGNEDNDRLCQIAWSANGVRREELFKAPLPISIEAMSVHHITEKMIADKPLFVDSPAYSEIKNLFEDENTIVVAHNAKFDIDMLRKENIIPKNHICTLKVARALDTDGSIPRYNLQFLRYFLGMEIEATAHDALGDVLVLEQLFERLLKKSIEQSGGDEEKALAHMMTISSQPSLVKNFNFGKHNGKTVAEVRAVDKGYLEWLLNQKMQDGGSDEDWVFTLKHYLGIV